MAKQQTWVAKGSGQTSLPLDARPQALMLHALLMLLAPAPPPSRCMAPITGA